MAKYRNAGAVPRIQTRRGPITTVAQDTYTYNGAPGFSRDAKSDLFLLAVTNMGSEDTFYESAVKRDSRFSDLVHVVTKEDPEWMQEFIPWLRKGAFMRTAPIIAAVEYVRAEGPYGRAVVASALQRADEPAVALGYWFATGGSRTPPKPLKRGIADAVSRLFNEYTAMKWDSTYSQIRLGDVLELTHARPRDTQQGQVFQWLVDRAHNPSSLRVEWGAVPRLQKATQLEKVLPEKRRALLRAEGAQALADAGITWERLSGWLPDGMDAEAWETLILADQLPYMATLRNLANFEKVGISDVARKAVITKLTDPAQVASSMQFPFRFLSAHKNTQSHQYTSAIEEALDLSCSNIPLLHGRTLVLIDVSGSMSAPVSGRSTVQRWEVGALFAAAANRRWDRVDTVAFGTTWEQVRLSKASSVLRAFDQIRHVSSRVGYSTEMFRTLNETFDGHDRVVIFTDEQSNPATLRVQPGLLYVFNLAGYAPAAFDFTTGRFGLGGFNDATFRQMGMLENLCHDAVWPWVTTEP